MEFFVYENSVSFGHPRKDFDNVATLVAWHDRYNLADDDDLPGFGQWLADLWQEFCPNAYGETPIRGVTSEMRTWIAGNPGYCYDDLYDDCYGEDRDAMAEVMARIMPYMAVFMPVYLLDHSGLSLSTSRFACPWDTSMIGYVYVTKDKALYESGHKRFCRATREFAERHAETEIAIYSAALENGDCPMTAEQVAQLDNFAELEPSDIAVLTYDPYAHVFTYEPDYDELE